MKKYLVLILCALLPAFALAQSPAPQARPDVEELLTAMKIEKKINLIMDQMHASMKAMMGNMAKQNGLSDKDAAKVAAMQDKVMALMQAEMTMEKMRSIFSEIYAETFTPEETKGLTEFYKSPAGQAFIEKEPQLIQKMMPKMQEMMMGLMPKIQEIAKEQMSEKSEAPAPKP